MKMKNDASVPKEKKKKKEQTNKTKPIDKL